MLDLRALPGHRRLRTLRARDHGALRHAAVAARGDRARGQRAVPAPSSRRAFARRPDPRRASSPPACPARGACTPAPCATSCWARKLLDATRRGAALRRRGHEERRRLRCFAPAVRLARHSRRHHGGVPQGAAAAARRGDRAARDAGGQRRAGLQPLGRRSRCRSPRRPGARVPPGCASRARPRRCSAARARLGGERIDARSRAHVLGRAARSAAALLRRSPRCGAYRCRRPPPPLAIAVAAADRLGRRGALVRRRARRAGRARAGHAARRHRAVLARAAARGRGFIRSPAPRCCCTGA